MMNRIFLFPSGSLPYVIFSVNPQQGVIALPHLISQNFLIMSSYFKKQLFIIL